MLTFRSNSVAETEAFGESLARNAPSGCVYGLSGDLGAGKTALVRGFARGLGCTGRVHSPTFALLNEYEGGRLRLFHLDLYRLNTPEEVRAAGLEEYVTQPDGVAVVEWVERWCGDEAATKGGDPGRLRRIHLSTLSENARQIAYDGAGP
ncbi:MAG TPA: tRNA (adenosine(37)-N6)-threonylcarbamoyltransferase complex ATPase subunit type 1 TsaE [Candidatus Limnocylindria bacterium]|jgi:tRNA threonylcarbamoyladenosine biosynthesis protein TsaE|nr:tRNA (adenosine(37)-N6)-threonylcarbamoyltransferase complex ATPase subunit type 1 TsaE [Candidatus Limnocylindria bacterium]